MQLGWNASAWVFPTAKHIAAVIGATPKDALKELGYQISGLI